jgi:hypothetical protein
VLESATEPRTTVQSALRWSESSDWKRDYMNAEVLTPEELSRLREENDRAKQTARATRGL